MLFLIISYLSGDYSGVSASTQEVIQQNCNFLPFIWINNTLINEIKRCW